MAQRSLFKRIGYCLTRMLARLGGVLVFRIRCQGRQRTPRQGGVLVCANHQSYLDPVLVGLACDRRLNFLARKTLFRFRPARWLLEFFDAIPIERDGFGLAGLRETLRRLERGEMVVVFPEGTRTPDGRVQPLKAGFCILARRAKALVAPVAIDGAFDAWPRWRRLPRPAAIHICFGEPISPELAESLSDAALVEELERRIRTCHAQARNGRLVLSALIR